MTKRCGKCAVEKDVELFNKNATRKDGLQSHCKGCEKAYRTTNADSIASYGKIYNKQNAVAIAARAKIYYAEWAKANSGKKNASEAKRRAAKIERTPAWANKDEIDVIYRQSSLLQKLIGRDMHVDHVVPLQGDLVSGLHVANNLQITFATLNIIKSNKFDIEEYNR
jgi:hypothetical protein